MNPRILGRIKFRSISVPTLQYSPIFSNIKWIHIIRASDYQIPRD